MSRSVPEPRGEAALRGSSPLLFLFVLMALGVAIEVIEQQNRQAAYAVVVVLILGMITFNVRAFEAQLRVIISVLNHPPAGVPSGGGGGKSGFG